LPSRIVTTSRQPLVVHLVDPRKRPHALQARLEQILAPRTAGIMTSMHNDYAGKTHLQSGALLNLNVSPLNPGPHVVHDLVPATPVDKDNVAQSPKAILVFVIQTRQLRALRLVALLQPGLLRGRLGALYIAGAETWM